MAEFSEGEARDARRIVEALLEPGEGARELDAPVPVSDVEADAAEFVTDMEMLEEVGADAPAVRVAGEELVPVALGAFAGSGWPWSPLAALPRSRRWRGHPFFREWVYMYRHAVLEGPKAFGAMETMPRAEARATFLRRATAFLATRIAALNSLGRSVARPWASTSLLNVLQRTGGPRVSTPGCHFTVSTNSSGLRVFWSGAYRVSPNYFSHPTTPTLGVLQAGTYLFGVDGGAYGNQIQWDLNAVVSLPGSPHAHLSF